MYELRRQIEKQVTDVGVSQRSLSEFRLKNSELEERISGLNKELHSSQELCKRLEIELKVRRAESFALLLTLIL